MSKMLMFAVGACALGAFAIGAGNAPPRIVADPVLEPIDGGQLICDPYDRAAGFQPYGEKVWALNWAAEQRLRYENGRRTFTEIPRYARANLDPGAIETLKERAEALC